MISAAAAIRITATFTAEPLEKPLRFLLEALKLPADMVFSPVNQVVPQLLDPSSEVRGWEGRHLFLLRGRDVSSSAPSEGWKAMEEAMLQALGSLKGPALVILCPHPDDGLEDDGWEEQLGRVVEELGHTVVSREKVENAVTAEDLFDAEAFRAGEVPYTDSLYAALALRVARQVHAWSRPARKLIVVDGDHTLWKGVIGEDGMDGIDISDEHVRLQRFLLEKRDQGFLLALASKNEPKDVLEVLRTHPGMLMKENDWVSLRVNWRAKSENVRELCQDLGLGIDSVIFIDDNPAETAEVEAGCPGVYGITLPSDGRGLVEALERSWAFDLGLPLTEEDRVRARLYQEKAEREAFRQDTGSFLEFLRGLELRVEVEEAAEADRTRLAQLSVRTNQFNAYKEPFTREELARRQADGALVLKVTARDRFGDYGLVGGMEAVVQGQVLSVRAFFLSCRALGKGVERQMVRRLGQEAGARGLETLSFRFQDSDRNGVCRAFLEEIGAVPQAEGEALAFNLPTVEAVDLDPLPRRDSAEAGASEAPSPVEPDSGTRQGTHGLNGNARKAAADPVAEVARTWQDPCQLARHLASLREPRPHLTEPAVPPVTEMEKKVLALWESVLGLEGLGVEDRFSDLGGRSLHLVQVHARLQRELQSALALTELFELPTVRDVAGRLENAGIKKIGPKPVRVARQETVGHEAVAIVGMAIRVPGADSIEQFWANVRDGVSSLRPLTDEELAAAGQDVGAVRRDPTYVAVKGCLEGIDRFDAAFFGILPKEAKLMDPQQRIFLELAWEALERGGYDPKTYPGRIGVWAGSYLNTYMIANLCADPAFRREWIPEIQVGSLQAELGNDKDYLATRVSFKLNLRGPSMTVQTACSTSMVAIAQAVRSLRTGESDMALAGGITITVPQEKGYQFTDGGILSKDGRVCTFSDEATGTVFSNGGGVILLKRLAEAERDGDHIHAVIRGVALNNDGGQKHSYTAPRVEGQAEVIAMAHSDAGVDPDAISYVEAHGTGTALGDPIEVAALTKTFRDSTERCSYCVLGSVKPNVGHLDVASGVTGIIKTALALEHAQIPPLLHFQTPNPKIPLAESPFRIETALTPWEGDEGSRLAGVSSFGVGGTNGHVIVGEAPPRIDTQPSSRPAQLFLLAARTSTARDAMSARLAAFARSTEVNIADGAYTTATGRRPFAQRRICVARDWEDLARRLEAGKVNDGVRERQIPEVSFMFPGQGAQHVGMTREAYLCEPIFRQHVDFCAEYLRPQLGVDLREILFPEVSDEAATRRLQQTTHAQPSIFVIETGLAKLWQSWGVTPANMIGHSVGEFAAACIAGVFTLEEGLTLLATRGRLMDGLPGGVMLSVRLSEDALGPYLEETDLAAVNGKDLCVLAGPDDVIDRVCQRLERDGVVAKALHTSHAFHSRMMDPVIAPFAEEVAKMELKPPAIPIYSTVTTAWLTDEQACDPGYWASHLRQPVRFHQALLGLAETLDSAVFLEAGPGQTLATLARRSLGRGSGHEFLASAAHMEAETSDYEQMIESLGRLWLRGVAVDWRQFYQHEDRHRVVLPPYPFERKRHWFEPAVEVSASPAGPSFMPDPSSAGAVASDGPVTSLPLSPVSSPSSESPMAPQTSPSVPARRDRLVAKMQEILSELSDIPEEELDEGASFPELGFDSLLLTQASRAFQEAFTVRITMRQLVDDLSSIEALANHLDATLDPTIMAPEPEPVAAPVSQAPASPAVPPPSAAAPQADVHLAPPQAPPAAAPASWVAVTHTPASLPAGEGGLVGSVIQQQMDLMRQQLALLQGGVPVMTPPSSSVAQAQGEVPRAIAPAAAAPPAATAGSKNISSNAVTATGPKRPAGSASSEAHGPFRPLNQVRDDGLTEQQSRYIAELTKRYNERTRRSKERTQAYRKVFADPRTASGFNRLWKDMCYQIIVERSRGSRLLDIDGNEYIDIVNGFGPGFLGHSPDFILTALQDQLEKTIAVGPQSEMAGQTAQLVCQLVGAERVCFVNTGSEAVQAALRLARTVTGKDRVVVFSKDYHGNFDEVLVKGVQGKGEQKSLPIAPGIPRRAVQDMLVLEYGTEESLEIIRQQAETLAAVVVEPIQSRRPEFQPKEFIRELRKITEETGCLFVFDEVITGFRTGPGGAQDYYGVKADLATYGKVIGGGMPVGLVAGKAEYMDTFDGGYWQYGDDSFPQAPVTFFAGTFVRHPLTVAAVHATAQFLLEQTPQYWANIRERAGRLAGTVDRFFQEEGIGIRMPNFGSQMFIRVSDTEKCGGLLFCQLREKGVFTLEGLPSYLTAAHSDADVDYVIEAFKESVADMRSGGFLGGNSQGTPPPGRRLTGPPRQLEVKPISVPLTPALQELWLACSMDERGGCTYNEATTLHIQGAVRVDYLKEALNEVISRHQALRATFSEDGSSLCIAPRLEVDLPCYDVSDLDVEARRERLRAFEVQEGETPFDLEQGPLVRAFLVKLGPEESVFFLTAHHGVCDGWSYAVVLEELSVLYGARCRGESAVLAPAHGFADYALEQASRPENQEVLSFWRDQFSPPPEPINLPLDRAYPMERSFAGGTERRAVSKDLAKALKQLGAQEKCTAFHTFLGLFEVLLQRLTGQGDFVVGTPAAGQALEEKDTLIGHCVNFLPLRCGVEAGMSFRQHLAQVRSRVLNAFEHQDFTYGELLPMLDLPRHPGRMPLVEVLFNVERLDYHEEFHGLKTVFDPSPKRFVNFPLFLNVVDSQDGVLLDCNYEKDLVDGSTVQRWLGHLEELARKIVEDPDAPLHSLSLLDAEEKQRLLEEWNDTARDFGPARCLHELIAFDRAEAPAVSQGEVSFTYRELEERANAVAARLQEEASLESEDLVGIFLDRHPRTLAALLGVLKAGGAYVPLDPSFPEERLQLMMQDAGLKAVITTEDLRHKLPATEAEVMILTDERRPDFTGPEVKPENLAYVIYTSGSTGKPKGVQIEHRSVTNFLRSMQEEPGFADDDVMLAVTTLCFDIAVLELYLPLMSGGRVEMATRQQASDPEALAALMESSRATHLQATPVTWRLLVESGWKPRRGFKMLCGGEPMPADLAGKLVDSEGELWNLYGPTETTVWSTLKRIEDVGPVISVGKPIANTSLYILDERLLPVAVGVPGRLFIGGHGLARGYAGRAELTAEKFVRNPFPSPLGDRIYDTGDLARYLPNGEVECLGRSDSQLKFNGYRIESGDIEAALLSHPAVAEAAVKLVKREGAAQLWAYVVPAPGRQSVAADDLRDHVATRLPDYMVPAQVHQLESMPLTPNRKIDRQALPEDLAAAGPQSDEPTAEPISPMSPPAGSSAESGVPRPMAAAAKIAGIWEELLGRSGIGREVNFFDAGGHSLLLLRLKQRLQEVFDHPIEFASLFHHTTIAAQAKLLAPFLPAARVETSPKDPGESPRTGDGHANDEPVIPSAVAEPTVTVVTESEPATKKKSFDIAVIGMSVRLPGAADLETFWKNVREGVESITDLSEEDLRRAGVSWSELRNPNYIRRGALIEDAEAFDCQLFGISPREAELMDPQHRVFLEECYKTLEDGGYDPARYAQRIGLFAGCGESQAAAPQGLLPSEYYVAMTGSQPDYLTTRVAYRLNLRGPSLTVQTGCSTSLVAVHLACQNLWMGECEMALAGGVTLVSPQGRGYLYEEGMMLSPDGHCRPFDADAQGTVFTQGSGMVLLKPLEDALRDGDSIRAVIKGSAINNDGAEKIGFTAPAIRGQEDVILKALETQQIDPETIGLVETHGTGTPLGDPVELAALSQAYRRYTDKRGYCALGGLKGNVGHLDAAAGIASFIKAVLALENEEIPPMIHYREPNSKISLEDSPFTINRDLVPWPRREDELPRRAAVSSFGIGGTNAHVILQEAPRVAPSSLPSRRWQVLPFSAKNQAALGATAAAGAAAVTREGKNGRRLADAAFTLQVGRPQHEWREVLLAAEGKCEDEAVIRSRAKERPIVFLFSGQGAAYHGMAREVMAEEKVFREAVEACDREMRGLTDWSLTETLYAGQALDWSVTERAQPALFAMGYAMAKLWRSWGVEPAAMIGHSIGEYVAACEAGVFTLSEAMRLVVERGRLMQSMPEGAMLSVPLDAATLRPMLKEWAASSGGGTCEIATENSPLSTVVSGSVEAIEALADHLEERVGQRPKLLATSHAFHSSQMEEAARRFRQVVGTVNLRGPGLPYLSNVTGRWITAEEATSPDYWCQHIRRPVRFSASVNQVNEDLGEAMWLEMGPGRVLVTLVEQHGGNSATVATLPSARAENADSARTLAEAVGRFWAQGGSLDWAAYHGPSDRRRVPLPGYQMQRMTFSPQLPGERSEHRSMDGGPESWLHEIRWQRWRPGSANSAEERRDTLLLDGHRGPSNLASPSWRHASLEECEDALADLVRESSGRALRVVVCGGEAPDLQESGALSGGERVATYEAEQSRVFDRLMSLSRGVTAQGIRDIEIVILMAGGEEMDGVAAKNLWLGGLTGAGLSLQQDVPGLRVRVIDVGPQACEHALRAAIESAEYEPLIVLRGRSSYYPTYLPAGSDGGAGDSSRDWLGGTGPIVVTGGSGLIGLALADWLTSHSNSPVVLVSRLGAAGGCGLVAAERLPAALAARVDRWESQGASVQFYRADVSEGPQVEKLFAEVEQLHGPIAGVVHLAGVVESLPLESYSGERRREIQRAKVHGALHLQAALTERHPRFVLLISSVSAVLGGVGYEPYAAGNAFLDCLAAEADAGGDSRWLALDLDAVTGEDQAQPHEMTPEEAAELMGHCLQQGGWPSRLVVSKTSLPERRQRWVYGMAQSIEEETPESENTDLGISSNQGEADHVAIIQKVWCEVLKLDSVEPEANFFELGGDSITAITVFQRLARAFGISLPLATLFQAPTPTALAKRFREAAAAETGSERPVEQAKPEVGAAAESTLIKSETQASPFEDHIEDRPAVSRNLVIKMKEGLEGKVPIFFTHPGGGSIVFYHSALEVMTHAHPMYGIESPLLSQERFDLRGMGSVEEVAQGYEALIRQVRPHGPYILAGYSFGGLVSLEIGRLLMERGEEVRLMVFDTPNPRADYHTNKITERLSYHWNKGGHVGEKLLKMSRRATQGMVNRIQTTVSRASARRMNDMETPSRSARILNFQILEVYDDLTERYAPQPYPGDMHLFVAKDQGDKVVYQSDLGWGEVVQGELSITEVPGTHLTLMEGDNVKTFVEALERGLRKPGVILQR